VVGIKPKKKGNKSAESVKNAFGLGSAKKRIVKDGPNFPF